MSNIRKTSKARKQPAHGGIGLEATVSALLQAMIVWDADNYHHCLRSADYAAALCAELGVHGQEAEHIRIGTLLHDIGKLGVGLAVLNKAGRLNAAERDATHRHAEMGASILDRVLPPAIVELVRDHHEQPDGNGYPRGLCADQISRGAAICRVAEVLDALTTDQPYRQAKSLEAALTELQAGAGTRYDEQAVVALFALIERRQLRPAA